MSAGCVVGIFLGGRGRRMGGRAKGLLTLPGTQTTLVAHLRALCEAEGLPCVAVGPTEAYAGALPGVSRVSDSPAGIGPLGGLGALLRHAGERPVIALACDMPHVTAALLARLAQTSSDADVLAPRDPGSGRWQPLFARYAPARVQGPLDEALAAGERSFQALFARLRVQELVLEPAEHAALDDWDRPEDVPGSL